MGPSLRAVPFGLSPGGTVIRRLLTARQQKILASLATRVSADAHEIVYREGALAASIFICSQGALKSFRDLPSGKRRILAFLFAEDLFGLAENGRYVNTVQALGKSMYYRIPVDALVPVLRQDPELEWQFLTKVTHELRESQRRALVVGHRLATGRIAMFLKMLERRLPPGPIKDSIPLPMSRSEVADYLGLSLEAVSRATSQLTLEQVISFANPHLVRVLNRSQLERIAADL
jgi:CRP-like cAMP-binding protein